MKIRGGVDPGKKGVVSWFQGDELKSMQIPTIGNEFDELTAVKLIRLLKQKSDDIHFNLEAVNCDPKWGAKQNFSFGEASMLFKAIFASLDIPYTRVHPKTWQKEMWQGVPLKKKLSQSKKTMVTDTKVMSEIAAKRLFPLVDFRRTTRCKNLDDNKIDSILIAEYCRRNF